MGVKIPGRNDEQEVVDSNHKPPTKVDFDRAFDEMAEFLFERYEKRKSGNVDRISDVVELTAVTGNIDTEA